MSQRTAIAHTETTESGEREVFSEVPLRSFGEVALGLSWLLKKTGQERNLCVLCEPCVRQSVHQSMIKQWVSERMESELRERGNK